MFCRFCGKEVKDDSKFCPYCGKPQGVAANIVNNTKEGIIAKGPEQSERNYTYYKKKADNMASYTLMKITKIMSYIALGVFLFFSIKMSPMYGWAKFFCYLLMAGIAISLLMLFNKKVFTGESKKLYHLSLFISVFAIVFSVGLRIVYEAKVDYVKQQMPSSGEILFSMSEKTEYYSNTGTGTIRNPKTVIRIGDKWYDSGDIIPIRLNESYSLRVGSGGSGSGGYTDGTLVISKSSLSNGKYTIRKEVNILSGPASMAEVTISFSRYCTFWEVIFY